jgi:hypothetical protein
VIAEGIENTEQLNLIRSLNCEYGQGFLFSKPVDSEKAEELLKVDLFQRQGRVLETGNGEHIIDVDQSSQESSTLTAAGLAPEGLPAEQNERIFPGATRSLFIILAALILLLAGGYAIKLKQKPSSPLGQASQPSVQSTVQMSRDVGATQQNVEIPANLENNKPILQDANLVSKPTMSNPLIVGRRREIPPGSKATVPLKAAPATTVITESAQPLSLVEGLTPPAKEALPDIYPVVHRHVLGSCKGNLLISRDTISFIPEKEKDGFTYKYDQVSYAVANDLLAITSGSKTHRFKSATAGSKEDNRSQLLNIVQSISRMHPDIKSTK